MAMFNKVSERIDAIYKDLTKREGAPMGGSAFLALEDAVGRWDCTWCISILLR